MGSEDAPDPLLTPRGTGLLLHYPIPSSTAVWHCKASTYIGEQSWIFCCPPSAVASPKPPPSDLAWGGSGVPSPEVEAWRDVTVVIVEAMELVNGLAVPDRPVEVAVPVDGDAHHSALQRGQQHRVTRRYPSPPRRWIPWVLQGVLAPR